MTDLGHPHDAPTLREQVGALSQAARAELFGDVTRSRALLDDALRLADADEMGLERARTLALRAWLRARSGDEGAADDARDALEWLEPAGETRAVAECHLARAILHATAGRYEAAFEPIRHVRVLAAKGGHPDLDAAALNVLGFSLSDLGGTEEADAVLRAAIRRAEDADVGAIRALAQANLAQNHVRHRQACEERGRGLEGADLLDEALLLLAEVKAYARPRGDLLGLAAALDNEAQVYNARREPHRALAALDEAMAIYRVAGEPCGTVYALCSRADASFLLGDAAEAVRFAREALALSTGRSARCGDAKAYATLAAATEAAGALAEALAAYKQFHALREDAVREGAINRTRVVLAQLETERARAEATLERTRVSALEAANDDLRAATAVLTRAAREDSLTGLYNRRALEEQLAERFDDTGPDHPVIVALLDVDDFKSINDQRSHLVGDAVLRQVASLVRTGLRKDDLAARFGGDEVLVVLDGMEAGAAHLALDRTRKRIADHPWEQLAPGLCVTVSIGWCDTVAAVDAQTAIATADRHLYEAKRTGRNRVVP